MVVVLHDDTVALILLVDSRSRHASLLHSATAFLEIFEALTCFGEVLS
jgi:hypothetical protein